MPVPFPRFTSLSVCALAAALLMFLTAGPASAQASWKTRIDKLVGRHAMSVSVSNEGRSFYSHKRHRLRTPASNEKLLLSMALLDRFDRATRIETSVAATSAAAGIVPGDLWLLGHGDPTLTGRGSYARQLSSFGATRLGKLALRIKSAGIKRIEGGVVGGTGYFARDWWAPGWERDFPAEEVALPTALSFSGNSHHWRHITDPERRAAEWLTKKLRKIGVKVSEAPRAARPPAPRRRTVLATVRSAPLPKLLRYMNRNSSNFFAEMLGKRLAVETYDGWGSIAKGAAAIRSFAKRQYATIRTNDSSGLSYNNRVSAGALTRLLAYSERQRWGVGLRSTLPGPGEGTLEDRLSGVKVRAKTGTLDDISALSGWVWLQRSQSWGEFSILSHGMSKYRAAEIEDRIVRIITRRAGPRLVVYRAGVSDTSFGPTNVAWNWSHRPLL